ncbi:DNA-binding response regulator [Exiguobacterium sp. s193]|uniref:DNA-binding response regulator n=1 Tax=Exiguobacterium sp. s193 TaxID=2751207 RepID=UPI001BE577F6|nr:DNA-binding response regulator [Exiguobacterium sp. s193]
MRREEIWRLIHTSIEPTNDETGTTIEYGEAEVGQSTSAVLFIHTVGVMPEAINNLFEEGKCIRTDISYADVVVASEPFDEERTPVIYLKQDEDDTFYLLENAREVIPSNLPKALILDRLMRYKRVQRVKDVVIVTEDPHLKRMLERELVERFETAISYERAEIFFEEHVAIRPFLLVFSSALPRADGLELLLRAKQQSIVPFHSIMISMYNRERDHVLAIERGVDGIMTLPLKVEEFRAWIRRIEEVRS